MSTNPVSAALRSGLFTRTVGKRILYFQELSSTMDEAARQAEDGAAEGTVVVAETQHAGRGRFGRTWVSTKVTCTYRCCSAPLLPCWPN